MELGEEGEGDGDGDEDEKVDETRAHADGTTDVRPPIQYLIAVL